MVDLSGLDLNPAGGLLVWIIVGLVAGFLASQFVKGGGYGLIGDLVIGLIGGAVGGFLVGFFVHTTGLLGSIADAFIGAAVLLFVVKTVMGGRRARRA
jgi:uncharacterized membrane protein YeaQ/YmgE (transglycosylase-associated protein family)